MKYPCNLIRDLLPLYHDGVCSKESIEAVEEHLSECMVCKEHLAALRETDQFEVKSRDTEHEMKRAASFQVVKKKLRRKQVVIAASVVTLLFAAAFMITGILKKSVEMIPYEDNISVSMTDDSLIGRLQGNQANYCDLKRVELSIDGRMYTYLFFCLSGSKWEAITTSDKVFSEYLLCSSDKGAAQIDGVFYYTGDYTGIENRNEDELQEILDGSVLLWSR